MTSNEHYSCTVDTDDIPRRRAQVQRLREGLLARRRDGDEIRLRFAPELDGVLAEFVRDESACCTFYDFELESGQAWVTLTIRAPDGARPLLDELDRAFGDGAPGPDGGLDPTPSAG